MMNEKLFLFLLLLPMISKSEMVQRINQPKSLEKPNILNFFDQLAMANNNWQTSNKIISATYAANPKTGQVRNANFVVNIQPHRSSRPGNVDAVASESLANTRTAEEYVNQALKLGKKLGGTPHSSFVKYDVYEKEETQNLEPDHMDMPMYNRRPLRSNAMLPLANNRHEKNYVEYKKPNFYPEEREPQANFNLYKNGYSYQTSSTLKPHNAMSNRPKHFWSENENSNFNEKTSVEYIKPNSHRDERNFDNSPAMDNSYKNPNEQVLQNPYKISSNRQKSFMPAESSNIHITKSSKKKPLNHMSDFATGDFYENFSGKDKSYEHKNTNFELYKPQATTSYNSASYSHVIDKIKNKTPSVDLTFGSKKRQNIIDLAALDVGQTWTHGPSYDHSNKGYNINNKKPKLDNYKKPKVEFDSAEMYYHFSDDNKEFTNYKSQQPENYESSANSYRKPKLEFNSQTYHDINAMDGSGTKMYSVQEPREEYPPKYEPFLIRDHLTSVGASISVEKPTDGYNEDPLKNLHVVNIGSATKPYKLNSNVVKQLLKNKESENKKLYPFSAHNINVNHAALPSGKLHTSFINSDNDYHENNYKNPENYQQNFHDINISYETDSNEWKPSHGVHRQRGTDLYTSSSAKDAKKVVLQSHSNSSNSKDKRKKVKSIKLKIKSKRPTKTKKYAQRSKSRDLDTELRPPPPSN